MWLIVALIGLVVVFFVFPGSQNAQGGDEFFDDWEDGDMDATNNPDLPADDGYDANEFLGDSYYYYDAGWGLTNQGHSSYDAREPYEGEYSMLGQLGYSWSSYYDRNKEINVNFTLDLSGTVSDYVYVGFMYTWQSYRPTYSEFYVEVYDGDDGTWTTVYNMTVTNVYYYSGSDEYEEVENLDISDYIGTGLGADTIIQFQLKSTYGSYIYPYQEYAKVDLLNVDIKESIDIAVDEVNVMPEFAEVGTNIAVNATVRNDAYQDYGSDIDFIMRLKDSDGTTLFTENMEVTGGLDVDETAMLYHNFSHVSEAGIEVYTVEVEADVTLDMDDWDDLKNGTCSRFWVKWFEDYETGDLVAPQPKNYGWNINERFGDQSNSYYDAGAGLTSETQYSYPYGSNDPYEGRHSAITRLSRYGDNARDVWMETSFNMDGWEDVTLSFYYDTYVYSSYQNWYRCWVQVSDDNGTSWTTLDGGGTSGSLPMDATVNNWKAMNFEISNNPDIDMTENVTVRFRLYSTSSYSYYSSYYFKWDYIQMTGSPFDNDLAIRELVLPGNVVSAGQAMDVDVTVKNVGKNDLTDVQLKVTLIDEWGAKTSPAAKTVGDLDSLEETTATFTVTPGVGTYIISATHLETDDFKHNDYKNATFQALPYAFWDDFEDENMDATDNGIPADGWWVNEELGDNSYYYSDGGVGLNSDYGYPYGDNSAYDGSFCQMYVLATADATDVWADFSIDKDDVSGLHSPLTLGFWYDIYSYYSWYKPYVLVTYDEGDTWTTIADEDTMIRDTTQGNWRYLEIDLPSWTGGQPDNITIRFEYKLEGYSYGYVYYWMKIDNIGLKAPFENDIAILDMEVPVLSGAGEDIPVRALVKNVGYEEQSDFDVQFWVDNDDGSNYATKTISSGAALGSGVALAPGESAWFETKFNVVFDEGAKDFVVYSMSQLEGDQDNTNNESEEYDLTVAWMAYMETFESGDLISPGALDGWNMSERLGDDYSAYSDSGAGLNTEADFGFYNTYGYRDPYAGTYCGMEKFAYSYTHGYAARTITMDTTLFIKGWKDLQLSFMYDTFYNYYTNHYYSVWANDNNGSGWVKLNSGTDLPKDSTANNWALYTENLSANPSLDLANADNVSLRFQAYKSYGYTYYYYNYFKYDNILIIGTPPDYEMAVTKVETDKSKVTAGDVVDITATLKNMGLKSQTNIDVEFLIEDQFGKTWEYTETSGQLTKGQTEDIELSGGWTTPSKPGIYNVTAYIELPESKDVNPYNNESTTGFETGLYIIVEDWETGDIDINNNELPGDSGWERSHKISQDGSGAGAGVTSAATHSDSGHGNAYEGIYTGIMQIDYYTRSVTFNYTHDMTGYKGAKLNFWYDTYIYTGYQSYSHVQVWANNNSGSGWVVLGEGDLTEDYSLNNWFFWEVLLNETMMTDELTIQFNYWTTSYSSDYYYFKFDYMQLLFLPENDLAVIDVDVVEYISPGRDQVINATISNLGWKTQSNFDVFCMVYNITNGTEVWLTPAKVTYSDDLEMFGIGWVEFTYASQSWDPRYLKAEVWTALEDGLGNPIDQDDSNNMSSAFWWARWVVFFEDFEGEEKLVAPPKATSGWTVNDELSGVYWDGGAGRSDDAYYYYSSSYEGLYSLHENLGYYYRDNTDDVWAEVSFNLKGWTDVEMSFYYAKYGSTSYHARVEYSSNGGTTWNLIQEMSQTGNGVWRDAGTLDLSSYPMTEDFRIRFRFYNTYYYHYYYYNFEIDNIKIYGNAPPPVENDIGVESISNPKADEIIPYNPSGAYTINAEVGNYGNNTVTFEPTMSAYNVEYDEYEYGTIIGDDELTMDALRFPPNTTDVAFNWTPELHGLYLVNVSVDLVGGGTVNNPENDMISVPVYVGSLYIDEDFEDRDYFSTSGINNEWERGKPKIVGPALANSGMKVWGTDLDDSYDPGHYGSNGYILLETPELERLTGYEIWLSYYHWYDTYQYYDGLNVQISTDGGDDWEIIYPEGGYDRNLYSNRQDAFAGQKTTWSQVFFNLTAYVGEKVTLKWQFCSYAFSYGYDGYYLDDLVLYGFSKRWDLMPTELLPSMDNPAFPDVADVDDEWTRGTVKNVGLDDFDFDVDARLQVHTMEWEELFPDGELDEDPSTNGWYTYTYSYGTTEGWQWGTPTNVGPSEAYSSPTCIGMDIDGNAGGDYTYSYTYTPYVYLNKNASTVRVSDLTFWEWMDTGNYHYTYLYVYLDGAYNYEQNRYDYGNVNTGGWRQWNIDVSGARNSVRLRFYYYTGTTSDTAPGWYVDDFSLRKLSMTDEVIYSETKSYTDGLDKGEEVDFDWYWTPSDYGETGFYRYNMSIESPDDEYAENDILLKDIFIGEFYMDENFEDGEEGDFDTADLSQNAIMGIKDNDLWHVTLDDSPFTRTFDANLSSYAWRCGYEMDDGSDPEEEWETASDDVYPHSTQLLNGSYAVAMDNALITPEIDLTQSENAFLSFWHRHSMPTNGSDSGHQGNDDGAFLDITNDGGTHWYEITPDRGYDGQIRTNAFSKGAGYYAFLGYDNWERETFDLSDFVGDSVQIRFRFTSYQYSDEYYDMEGTNGWWIDDMVVYGSNFGENYGLGHVDYSQDLYTGGTLIAGYPLTIGYTGGYLADGSSSGMRSTLTVKDSDGSTVASAVKTTTDWDSWAKTWTPSLPGQYDIEIVTDQYDYEEDENPFDNNYTGSIYVYAEAASSNPENNDPGDWFHRGSNDLWKVQSTVANSGDYAWYFGEYNTTYDAYIYKADAKAALGSPIVDLRAYSSAYLTWSSLWSTQRDHDGWDILISTDGETWDDRFGSLSGTVGQDSHSPWWENPTFGHPTQSLRNLENLNQYVDEQVLVRFMFTSDRDNIVDGDGTFDTPSGVWLDDIMIYGDQYKTNIAINNVIPGEEYHHAPGSNPVFDVNISNVGREDVMGVMVNLTIVDLNTGDRWNWTDTSLSLDGVVTGQEPDAGSVYFDEWEPDESMDGHEVQITVTAYLEGDEVPSNNEITILADVLRWKDIAIAEFDVPEIIEKGKEATVSAEILNNGNVDVSDFNVSFAVGNASIQFENIGDKETVNILIYNGYYSYYDTQLYYDAVMEVLQDLYLTDTTEVTVKNRAQSGYLTDSDIENNDIIIYVQRYGRIGYYANNEDPDKLEDFLDDGGSLFLLGKDVAYYGTSYYNYYRTLMRDYLKCYWGGDVYESNPDFLGQDRQFTKNREWEFRSYGPDGLNLRPGGTALYKWEYFTYRWAAGVQYEGVYAGSEEYRSFFVPWDFYDAGPESNHQGSNVLDDYEVDLMKTLIQWFYGDKVITRTFDYDNQTFNVGSLAPGESTTLEFTWDENLPSFAMYTFSVASELEDDNFTWNDMELHHTNAWTIKFESDGELDRDAGWETGGTKDQWHNASLIWDEGGNDESVLYYSDPHAFWCGVDSKMKYSNGVNAYLQTPNIELTTMDTARVGFWTRYATQEDHDGLEIFVQTEDSPVPQKVEGSFIDGYNDFWEFVSFDISEFAGGNVSILFFFTSDSDDINQNSEFVLWTGEEWSGVFIDDLIVYGVEYDHNVAPIIEAPKNNSVWLMNTDVPINAQLRNRGVNDEDDVRVEIKIFDQADPDTDLALNPAKVSPGKYQTVDIQSGYTIDLDEWTFSLGNKENVTYVIQVMTDMVGDQNKDDDLFEIWIVSRPRYDLAATGVDIPDVVAAGVNQPMNVTYENLGNTQDQGNFTISVVKLLDSILLTEDMEGASVPGPKSPSTYWSQNSLYPYAGLRSHQVNSPYPTITGWGPGGTTYWEVDIGDLTDSPNPSLSYFQMYNLDQNDGAFLNISTDGGVTWQQIAPGEGYPSETSKGTGLGSVNMPAYNGYDDEWSKITYDLTNYRSDDVLVRFMLAFDSSLDSYFAAPLDAIPAGWYIDDVVVTGSVVSNISATKDPAPTSLLDPEETETQAWSGWTTEFGNYFVRLEVNSSNWDEDPTNDVYSQLVSVAEILFQDDGSTYKETGWMTTVDEIGGGVVDTYQTQWHYTKEGSAGQDKSPSGGEGWWCGEEDTGTYRNGIEDSLITAPINMTHSEFTYMRFYHRYSFENFTGSPFKDEDAGYVDVAAVDENGDPTGEWVALKSFENEDDMWARVAIDLTQTLQDTNPEMLNGSVRFRFRCNGGLNPMKPAYTGWYVDDIMIYGQPFDTNIGVDSVEFKSAFVTDTAYNDDPTGNSKTPYLVATIKNYGKLPVDTSDVTIHLDIVSHDPDYTATLSSYNDWSLAYVLTTFNEITPPDQLDEVNGDNPTIDVWLPWTTPTLPNDIADNNFTISIYTELGADEQPHDDKIAKDVLVGNVFGYWNGNNLNGFIYDDEWTTTTYKAADGSAFYCGDTDQDPPAYGDGWDQELITPEVHLTNARPALMFWHSYDFNTSDYGRIYIYSSDRSGDMPDRPDEWTLLAQFNGSKDPMEFIPLTGYADQYVRIKFYFHSNSQDGGGGWFIDDITLFGLQPYAVHVETVKIEPTPTTIPKEQYNGNIEFESYIINMGANNDTIDVELDMGAATHWRVQLIDTVHGVTIVDTDISTVGSTEILEPGEVIPVTVYVSAPDEDHFTYDDADAAVPRTFNIELASQNDPTEESEDWVKAKIPLPDAGIGRGKIFMSRSGVMAGGEVTFWVLIWNDGTYMHDLHLTVDITGAQTGMKIKYPDPNGTMVTKIGVTSVEFAVGDPELYDTQTATTVLPPTQNNEPTANSSLSETFRLEAGMWGERYLMVPVMLENIPAATNQEKTLYVTFRLGSAEDTQSPETGKTLTDADTSDNSVTVPVNVADRQFDISSFMVYVPYMMAAMVIVSLAYSRKRREEDEE